MEILDLEKRTPADKVLRNEPFNIAKDLEYDGFQRGLASMVYKFFHRKTKGGGLSLTIKSMPQNKQLAEELHKPLLENLEKEKCIQHSKTIFGC